MRTKVILALASISLILLFFASCVADKAPTPKEPQQAGSGGGFLAPTLQLSYTWKAYDSKGKLLSTVTRPSHSYVQGMAALLNYQMSESGATSTIATKDTGGVSRTIAASTSYSNYVFKNNAVVGIITNGIVAGTGTNAVTEGDYALQTLIAHGTGSGQLSYGAMSYTQPATVGSSTSFTLSRTLTNSSGGTITINEVGVYSICYVSTTPYYFCIIRDLSSQAIINTHNVVLTYTITVSN